ncbi:amino acid permease 3-like [Cicer arietinum]
MVMFMIWRVFSSMGNIALACTYATVIYDIMDTLKSHPPENKQMKKANVIGVSTMTMIFLLCSCLGYAAFGDHTPGNIFAGFYEPFWLVALGDTFIVIHMIGAYQVMGQPFFRVVEMGANIMWPDSNFINKEYPISLCGITINLKFFRLIWRTIFVIIATILAMAMPFFNEVLSFLGAIGFGPLVVFFPIQMHIAQKQIRTLSMKWCVLQFLNCLCFIVSLAAIVASIHEISKDLHKYKLFKYKQ